jgi:hypothetical protein
LHLLYTLSDLKKYPGLVKIQNTKGPCVCMICFENPLYELNRCVFSTDVRYNPSNLKKHLESKHDARDAPAYFGHLKTAKEKSIISKASSTSVSTNQKQGTRLKSMFVEHNSVDAKNIFNRKVHRFVNRCGISFKTAHAPEFRDLMQFVVVNASSLKPNVDKLFLGPSKYKSISETKMEEMCYVISELVQLTRNYYTSNTGKEIPFITLSHDIWESVNADWMGVSIYFVLPHTWETIMFPIAMKKTPGKKSYDIVNMCKLVLER